MAGEAGLSRSAKALQKFSHQNYTWINITFITYPTNFKLSQVITTINVYKLVQMHVNYSFNLTFKGKQDVLQSLNCKNEKWNGIHNSNKSLLTVEISGSHSGEHEDEIFWDIVPCCLVEADQPTRHADDTGSKHLRNVG
jgi:hypothetical protein